MVKILVIDDDRMNCELIQSVFTRHGYQVLSATSGIEGLTLFRRQVPRVTILDLRMPEMDGLTVLKEIRAYDPHAPVIILGGGATEEQENQARGLRVTDFIRKGLSLDVLVECVNRVVQLPAKVHAWHGRCRSAQATPPTRIHRRGDHHHRESRRRESR
ncbi:MAG: response regulator [Nitrospirae bacterium]|nr:MAG: response regulator [Nitrospirota bacterium]